MLAAARIVQVLLQVCSAVQEAHAKGLIHRDIKPSNIIVCERGGIYDLAKLLDFGLVQPINRDGRNARLTPRGWLAGTPAFMSPEQAQARSGLDARSDIYSLGAVAYFLLVGRPPFHHPSISAMLTAHAVEAVCLPSRLRADVPADLESVVLRCLEKQPPRRFQDVACLTDALAACACASRWTLELARGWWLTHEKSIALIGPFHCTGFRIAQHATQCNEMHFSHLPHRLCE